MQFTVNINESEKYVKVHANGCTTPKEFHHIKKEEFSLYCKTYEEAWSWISFGRFDDEYIYEDCSCCNPGDWNQL